MTRTCYFVTADAQATVELAVTGDALVTDAELIQEAKEEWERQGGDSGVGSFEVEVTCGEDE